MLHPQNLNSTFGLANIQHEYINSTRGNHRGVWQPIFLYTNTCRRYVAVPVGTCVKGNNNVRKDFNSGSKGGIIKLLYLFKK